MRSRRKPSRDGGLSSHGRAIVATNAVAALICGVVIIAVDDRELRLVLYVTALGVAAAFLAMSHSVTLAMHADERAETTEAALRRIEELLTKQLQVLERMARAGEDEPGTTADRTDAPPS